MVGKINNWIPRLGGVGVGWTMFIVFFALGLFLVVLPAFAAGDYGTKDTLKAAGLPEKVAGAGSVTEVIGAVIGVVLSLLGLVFFGLIFYAGFQWMTAQGNSEQVDKAKTTIVSAVLGLIIVLAAYAITNFVFSNLATGGTDSENPDKPCLDNGGFCSTPSACTALGSGQTVTGLCSGGNVCCIPSAP